jgi:chromosome segregation ATPase
VIELTVPEDRALQQRFVVPTCYGSRTFFERSPPIVTEDERSIISGMSAAEAKAQLARDAAAMMRLWETALVLTDEKGGATKDLVKAREMIEKLEAALAKAEADLLDYKGKYEVFVEQAKELRETREELARLQEEVKSLKLQVAAEQKEKEELKCGILPSADETDATRGLVTRAQLVGEIIGLQRDTLEGASYAFNNAIAQLKIANPGVELTTEGTGLLYQVQDGKIVVSPAY